jgi:hypothetical protein
MKWLLLCLPLFGCAQTCEDPGSKLVQDGHFYVWHWIDLQKGVGYLQQYPNFICSKEKSGG